MSGTINNIKTITASKGMVLTNDTEYSSVGGKVYLCPNDSVENWHEITYDEYQQILTERDAAVENAMSNNIDNGQEI